jgi:hypothetical protein
LQGGLARADDRGAGVLVNTVRLADLNVLKPRVLEGDTELILR